MKFYLGVDGGGTKTSFYLSNEQGIIQDYFETSTCHINQVGVQGIKDVFNSFLNKHLDKQISYAVLGIPGYGEADSWDHEIEQCRMECFGKNSMCINDVKVGWAGSLLCQPGINLVAGTGSIAYGENALGESARTSGWGHFLGDEGSAFWIGKKGLEIFTKEADGRLEKTPLYYIFKKNLNLLDDKELIDFIYNKINFSRTEIANFSKYVYEAAQGNDSHALEIFNEAGKEISFMVLGILNNIKFSDKVNISYSGGVFKSEDFILNPIKNYLDSFKILYVLSKPELEPGLGAVLYGLKQDGVEITNDIIENFKTWRKI